jgi:hypothetical protein
MKNFNSTIENEWKEQLNFTTAQLETLKNGTDNQKKAVIEAVNVVVSANNLTIINAIYNQHKPTEENYEFIGCNLTTGEETRGIINYRVSGEHKQIRF